MRLYNMSTLKNMDWFEPIEEYTPDNKIIDILEENDDDTFKLDTIGYNSETFDSDTFSLTCELW